MNSLKTRLEENLGRGLLAILFIGCILVMWPFATALLWAAVLSFSIWPLYGRVCSMLGGRQTLAVLLLSFSMLLIVVVPLGVVGFTLKDNVTELKTAAQSWLDKGLPPAPLWVAKIPVVGKTATEKWNSLAGDSSKLAEKAKSLIEPVGALLLKAGVKLGIGLVQIAISILLAGFILRRGTTLAERLTDAIRRIGGERGAELLLIAGKTVRGVVYGILGTALVQGVMAGIGLLIAGVPGAGVLALLTFFLSVVPMGPPLVLIPASLWLFHQGSTGWGVFMLIWAVAVSTVDNFVKPWLISQGSDMPFVLIMFGVLGGALAFGFIGVFIGPTLLALGYRLVHEWSVRSASAAAAPLIREISPRLTHEPITKA